jgi:hypothetical protein
MKVSKTEFDEKRSWELNLPKDRELTRRIRCAVLEMKEGPREDFSSNGKMIRSVIERGQLARRIEDGDLGWNPKEDVEDDEGYWEAKGNRYRVQFPLLSDEQMTKATDKPKVRTKDLKVSFFDERNGPAPVDEEELLLAVGAVASEVFAGSESDGINHQMPLSIKEEAGVLAIKDLLAEVESFDVSKLKHVPHAVEVSPEEIVPSVPGIQQEVNVDREDKEPLSKQPNSDPSLTKPKKLGFLRRIWNFIKSFFSIFGRGNSDDSTRIDAKL